jgi:hypothetical protein
VKAARRGRPPVYDWDRIVDRCLNHGEEQDFVSGADFVCTPQSFGMLVRRTARRRGLKYVVSVDGEHVYFYFTKP